MTASAAALGPYQLQANDAGTDQQEAAGHLVEAERARRRDNGLLVDLNRAAGKRRHLRACAAAEQHEHMKELGVPVARMMRLALTERVEPSSSAQEISFGVVSVPWPLMYSMPERQFAHVG